MDTRRVVSFLAKGSRGVWRLFARLEFAALLLAIVLLLAAIGSALPQLPSAVAEDAAKLALWRQAVQVKYGPLADVLWALGLFRFARSVLFLVPLALLILSTLLCTANRWRGVWHRALNREAACADTVFEAASYRARLEFPAGTPLQKALQESLRERGFRVRSEVSGDTIYLRGDRNRLFPLATLINHLALLVLLAGALLSSLCAWREELTIPPDATAPVNHYSGLAVRNEGLAILRYPSGAAASYEAAVSLLEEGREALSGTIRLNAPLAYRRLRIYLRGYEGKEGAYTLFLLVGYDPGYPLFVAGGGLLLVGLCFSFFLPQACIRARISPQGALDLAGHAGRQAYAFEREFAGLVAELKQRLERGSAT